MSDDKKEKRLWPGDVGYKGGIFTSTVTIDGKTYEVKTVKDPNGNILSTTITPKIFGLF